MKQTLVLNDSLPTMNEIIAMSKQGKKGYQPYARSKAEITEWIVWECNVQKLNPLKSKADFTITWICKDKRKDKDGIMCGCKYIFDGLQHAGIIKNDGWLEIGDISHKFEIGKEQVKIEMEEII